MANKAPFNIKAGDGWVNLSSKSSQGTGNAVGFQYSGNPSTRLFVGTSVAAPGGVGGGEYLMSGEDAVYTPPDATANIWVRVISAAGNDEDGGTVHFRATEA